ncbi:universal stress protein [Haloplanus aerogenes]|uniref:Universal stress protein n=1 Tax=Haloplanus aerogenes TaxID=660522 RepID=A0A3G8QNU2_9EURY|nr:universal stress protein [Haloplanus aerogenes]AZH24133.1 universal stress protein [Haloplanus aerogenes]
MGGNTTDQYERWIASRREFADELLDHAHAIADEHGVTLDTAVAFGKLTDTIREYCEREAIDTVILGSTDRGAFSSYVVDDDVTRIANTAPVPVVVV